MSDIYKETYLEFLKQRNIERAKFCHICKKPSTDIESDGYRIIFVCDDHVRKEMPPRPEEEEADIWATQVTFE